MTSEHVGKATLLLMVCLVSAVFLMMVRHFLLPVLLAGIFAALAQPLYRRVNNWSGNRRSLASFATLLFVIFVILVPLGILMGIVASQAIEVGESVQPWVKQQLAQPDSLSHLLEKIPFYDRLAPYRGPILQKAGEMVGSVSRYLIDSLSALAVMTANFLFSTVILLYAMFFFLKDGDKVLARILLHLPMEDGDERLLLEKLTSTTRATLKGTLVIGIIQGGLAGVAFRFAGIPNAVFWGGVMAVLSLVPNIGSALIWLPASIVLMFQGEYLQGTGLLLFCSLVVGSADNFLRPALVGKETEVHELMVFLSTLGGLALFGFIGLILGPVIAAVFISLWDMYGIAFKNVLPSPGAIIPDAGERLDVIGSGSENSITSGGEESADEPAAGGGTGSDADENREEIRHEDKL